MSKKIIIRGIVKRHNGFLYYIDASGNLCIDVYDELEHLNKKYRKIASKQMEEFSLQ